MQTLVNGVYGGGGQCGAEGDPASTGWRRPRSGSAAPDPDPAPDPSLFLIKVLSGLAKYNFNT